jgi:hypothetical protein
VSAALALPTTDSAPASITDASPRLLTVRPAPRREPPFDDEIPAALRSAVTHFDRPLPFPRPVVRAPIGERRRYDPDLPEPMAWGRRLLIGLVEAAAGKRPLHQLANLLTASIAQGLQSELHRAHTCGQRHWLNGATLRGVHAMQPRQGVAEISVTLDAGTRVRAVALRIERRHDQWRCTRIVLG